MQGADFDWDALNPGSVLLWLGASSEKRNQISEFGKGLCTSLKKSLKTAGK